MTIKVLSKNYSMRLSTFVQTWKKNNQSHRDDGPAVIYATGGSQWVKYGYTVRNS